MIFVIACYNLSPSKNSYCQGNRTGFIRMGHLLELIWHILVAKFLSQKVGKFKAKNTEYYSYTQPYHKITYAIYK